MSKVILVMDKPDSCLQCPCSDFDKQNVCQALVRLIDCETEGYDDKPEWCPLKQVPPRTEVWDEYDEGYNEAIDKILGD